MPVTVVGVVGVIAPAGYDTYDLTGQRRSAYRLQSIRLSAPPVTGTSPVAVLWQKNLNIGSLAQAGFLDISDLNNQLNPKAREVFQIVNGLGISAEGYVLGEASRAIFDSSGVFLKLSRSAVLLVPMQLSSEMATNSPWTPIHIGETSIVDLPYPDDYLLKRDGLIENRYFPGYAEAAAAEELAFNYALTVYYNGSGRSATKNRSADVDMQITVKEGSTVMWSMVNTPKTPIDAPALLNPASARAQIKNLTKGGLYRYNLRALGRDTAVQVWLPSSGPDITNYWEREVNYYRSVWGPAYQKKSTALASKGLGSKAAIVKLGIATNHIRKIGPRLDWEDEKSQVALEQAAKGLANVIPGGNGAGDRDRFTIYGVVIDFAKRNNMMYALISSRMGIPVEEVKYGPDIADYFNRLFGNSNTTGTPDSPAAREAYAAGIDLSRGVPLRSVMSARGLKMQEPNSRAQREWPSDVPAKGSLTLGIAKEINDLIK